MCYFQCSRKLHFIVFILQVFAIILNLLSGLLNELRNLHCLRWLNKLKCHTFLQPWKTQWKVCIRKFFLLFSLGRQYLWWQYIIGFCFYFTLLTAFSKNYTSVSWMFIAHSNVLWLFSVQIGIPINNDISCGFLQEIWKNISTIKC